MKNKSPFTKYIVLIIAAILVLGIAFGVVAYLRKDSRKPIKNQDNASNDSQTRLPNTVDYSPSNPSENDSINQEKNNGGPTPAPTNANMTATITNTRIVNSKAQVSVLIAGTNSGTCHLTLTKANEQTVDKTVAITVKNGITTCENFDIPVSELTNGSWKAVITLTNQAGETSAAAEGSLQVGS